MTMKETKLGIIQRRIDIHLPCSLAFLNFNKTLRRDAEKRHDASISAAKGFTGEKMKKPPEGLSYPTAQFQMDY